MRHKKNFLREPINYLAILMQNFRQIEKYIPGQKILFFSRLSLVNCINPTSAAPSCRWLSWQNKPSSTSHLDMKGEAPRRKRGPCFLFFLRRIPSSPEMDCKRRDKGAKKALSQCWSYIELHDDTRLDKTELFCLSRLWAESPGAQIPAEAEEVTKPHVRERKKHIAPFTMGFP